MAYASLIGNPRVAEALRRALARDRLPHALLFAGPEGVGKRTFALELARAATCLDPREGEACGACASCVRSASGEHPDIRIVSPDGAFIKIAQVRELAREAVSRPYEGTRSVMIIDDAHRLREEAANALLKTLEEPAPTTLIVLVTDQPYALLETIRSRCQTLRFSVLTPEEIERFLAANYKRPADETRLLSRIAAGRIGKALATDLSVYRERRKEMLGLVEVLAGDRDRVRLMKAAQYMADVARKEKSEFDARLDVFVALCRDVYGLALGESVESIANSDIALRLQEIAGRVEPSRVAGWAEAIDVLKRQLRRNVNRQIALEAIFVGLAD
jgi:DNA polymerase-3 subunit delta'